jgi:hypothetical protein
MYDLIWATTREARYAEAQVAAGAARDAVRTLTIRVEELERRIEALTLASQALWELAGGRLDLPEAAIAAKMQEIDLRDGRADGKVSTTPQVCSGCNRTTSGTRRRCVYCGATLGGEPVFRKVH